MFRFHRLLQKYFFFPNTHSFCKYFFFFHHYLSTFGLSFCSNAGKSVSLQTRRPWFSKLYRVRMGKKATDITRDAKSFVLPTSLASINPTMTSR